MIFESPYLLPYDGGNLLGYDILFYGGNTIYHLSSCLSYVNPSSSII